MTLTGSGLSITEWNPIMGVIPPLNDQSWAVAFQKYQATTQYRFVNRGISLAAFQSLYWWEWAHRLLGRLVGVVFAGPLIAFLALGRIPRRLVWRCVVLLGLGGLQGLVGWLMVETGLVGRVTVAPEALMTHLGLALILYAALIWTGLEAWAGPGGGSDRSPWRPVTALLAGLTYLQCLLGALVAGNQAGLVDNDWPLMNGRVCPSDYWIDGPWRSLLRSQATVQFNHRLVAYVTVALALGLAVAAWRARELAGQTRMLVLAVAALLIVQASLGVATLMAHAPLDLSQMHQALATVVLSVAVVLVWRSRRV